MFEWGHPLQEEDTPVRQAASGSHEYMLSGGDEPARQDRIGVRAGAAIGRRIILPLIRDPFAIRRP